jgi:hypothetical protein
MRNFCLIIFACKFFDKSIIHHLCSVGINSVREKLLTSTSRCLDFVGGGSLQFDQLRWRPRSKQTQLSRAGRTALGLWAK